MTGAAPLVAHRVGHRRAAMGRPVLHDDLDPVSDVVHWQAMPSQQSATPMESLEAFALALPGAFTDMPWEGDVVAKVGKKIFVFFGSGEPAAISVKLPESAAHALTIDGAVPTSYGLGKHGWVTVPVGGSGAPSDMAELLEDWIEESYRTIAPKRLVADLDARP